jgi:predicted HAD superfamily Cof-like phosphohydrolase
MSKVFTDVHMFMRACDHMPSPTPSEPTALSDLYKTLIDEEYGEFQEAFDAGDDAEQLDACFDMIWVIVAYAKARGWDLDKAWDEGAKSNLFKIDQATGKVIRREDGKILKPQGWKEPDFAQFVVKKPKPAGIK